MNTWGRGYGKRGYNACHRYAWHGQRIWTLLDRRPARTVVEEIEHWHWPEPGGMVYYWTDTSRGHSDSLGDDVFLSRNEAVKASFVCADPRNRLWKTRRFYSRYGRHSLAVWGNGITRPTRLKSPVRFIKRSAASHERV